MKNYNMILTEKLRRYQHYHLEKLIGEILPSDQSKKIEQTKSTCCPLGKALKKLKKNN